MNQPRRRLLGLAASAATLSFVSSEALAAFPKAGIDKRWPIATPASIKAE